MSEPHEKYIKMDFEYWQEFLSDGTEKAASESIREYIFFEAYRAGFKAAREMVQDQLGAKGEQALKEGNEP